MRRNHLIANDSKELTVLVSGLWESHNEFVFSVFGMLLSLVLMAAAPSWRLNSGHGDVTV